jgi:hypothetical protein
MWVDAISNTNPITTYEKDMNQQTKCVSKLGLLGRGSFHFLPCIPSFFFWVLWFIYDWHGFII